MNMALPSCFFSSQICVSFKIDRSRVPLKISSNKIKTGQSCMTTRKSVDTPIVGPCIGWSFLGGSIRTLKRPNLGRIIVNRKSSAVNASCLLNSEIASYAFTVGTAAVLPFYTLMVVTPQAQITKKLVGSSIPYIVLGTLYAYLLYLSWTPDTIRLMFASKYWLPELPGMAQMFSSEMTLASAWIHLLVVDLFAARQVYYDGQQNNIETRHSVSLCLLFCPVGIVAHLITKALSRSREKTEHEHGIN